MSTGARSPFNAGYEPLLFDVARLPFPHKGREQEMFRRVGGACRDSAAAFVVEPLISAPAAC